MTDSIVASTGVRAARTSGTVRVVGAGLLGSSIGHALRALGVDVVLADASPAQLRLAVDYGAGRAAAPDDRPALVVVAVPPDVVADVVERELRAYPGAVVTDVASVKLEPLHALRARGVDLTHYIGSHPMAGRERGGAISARADIFVGRPWVVCRDEQTPASDLALVEGLALDLGATPIEMTPEEHDRAVALVSHVPQLVASLLAGRFVDAPGDSLRLAGQGVRDTTRIAASAPELWVQILGANAAPVVEVLDALAGELGDIADALRSPDAPGARRAVADMIRRGNDGVDRLPGKHGQNRRFEQLVIMVDDTPGQLGRLFGELGELGVNVEDLRLEHSPGAQFGLAEISVAPGVVRHAEEGLLARGWKIASIPS
ncbi:prephenate dehydrogenase [Microbacterium dextranolyticum]|uniref:Prephenate dehydrogenase n=1 Tax=Microbacterium dextranolyticum TaxID=36806 RepID=A0A9W6HP52_9MICO|nr:prephenate dehydrogenase [Microbacterium dextranolyticum]MBM7462491.1 prephenate dehydrogenase [Microbacterium dextranolyticum]GLJ96349.1 prephenate dehydrogenase [Microbacterium dextranolyticum]